MGQVLVVGAGLGGLSAAIYAKLKGHDVLVVEKGTVGGKAGSITMEGYTLDPGPSIIILKNIYEQVFQDAGRNLSDYLEFVPLDPLTRVFFNGDIIDIPASLAAAVDLVKGISPKDVANFEELMAKLDGISDFIKKTIFDHPYNHPWQLLEPNLIKTALPFDLKATFKDSVDSLFESPLLRAFFYGFPSYGGQSYLSRGPGAYMIPYFMFSGGVWYPKGGVSAIPRAFERLARELGVEFQVGEAIAMKTTGNRITGVELGDGSTITKFDKVVCNRDRVSVMEWIGTASTMKPSYSYFTIHLGVKRTLPNVLHHTLIVPDDFTDGFESLYRRREFPENPIVYLNNTSATDPGVAPDGHTNLFAVITSPANEKHLNWANRTGEYEERTMRQLSNVGINVDLHDLAMKRIQTPEYFEQEHGNFKGSLYGADEKHRLFGLFPWRNYDEKIKNLTYVGGAVQPGAGLPMVTLSGKFAAERL